MDGEAPRRAAGGAGRALPAPSRGISMAVTAPNCAAAPRMTVMLETAGGAGSEACVHA
jgi:hypothetical protein